MKRRNEKQLIATICLVFVLSGMLILLLGQKRNTGANIASGNGIIDESGVSIEIDVPYKVIERSGAEFFPNDLNGHTLGYIFGNHFTAQSFLVSETTEYRAIELKLRKIGNPASPLKIEIQTDDDNMPSGEMVENSVLFLDPMRLNGYKGDYEWVYLLADKKFNLTAGERYWIVPTCFNCDEQNKYDWQGDAENNLTYSKGGSLDTIDFGNSWQRYDQEDMAFRILFYEKVSN
jgi:hypothetical protein